MAIDKNNLPPQLQALLNDLEKMGIKPTIVDGDELAKIAAAQGRPTSEASSTDSTEKPCDCPACTLRKTLEARLEKSGPSAALGALPPNILAVLDKQAAKVAVALTDQVKKMVEPLRMELARQKEINDNNMARIADLNRRHADLAKQPNDLEKLFQEQSRNTADQIEYYRNLFIDVNRRLVDLTGQHHDLEARFSDLAERHRKQVGLLHKRVTKRKGEVAVVRGRVAATRGKITKLTKKNPDGRTWLKDQQS